MKLLSVILISLFSVTNYSCLKKFELIKATSQKWHGGIKGSGYGTYYELTIVPNSNSDNLVFDKLWIGKDYFDVQCFQKGKKMRNNLFAKGDTVTIRVNKANNKYKPMPFITKEGNTVIQKELPPINYKGAALLSYVYKKKRKYYEINKFTVSEPVFYP
ncbi:MAG: hypothetical protein L3J56_13300 [Bacteroidales bacterium]|nr:hypothetical protein [Bacteroidales bacterium]